MKTAGIFLVTVALIAGAVGCPPSPAAQYELTISSTEGGSVTAPGEGTFTYEQGTVVDLVAEAEEGYQFVSWTGDVGTIANVNDASTMIIMNGNYSTTANFEEMPPRTGAWLDEVIITVEPYPAEAVLQLAADELDVYACNLVDASLYAQVLADPSLRSAEAIDNYTDFTFNPVGPVFPETGKLNPFSVPEIREAMHWLVDREYIAEEIMGGLGEPRYTCLNSHFADAVERYPEIIGALEAKYAHDPARAEAVIREEMERLGAVPQDGVWMYNEESVELIFLIRVEDERKDMGDYLADLLEGLGFAVTRQYATADSLWQICLLGDPALGLWHIYTGGWVCTAIHRDQGDCFGYFYTNLRILLPLWQAYENDPVFYDAADRLYNYDYTTMEERRQLFDMCAPASMEENQLMFLVTGKSFSPMRAGVRLAADLVGGILGSPMWAVTVRFVDDEHEPIVGGTMRIATADSLTGAWNPIAGSGLSCDTFPIWATSDWGVHSDTRNGLRWPGRIERAEVYVQEGLPMDITHDWLTLELAPEIVVPPDAWSDWNTAEQRFITVAERFPEGTTALRKSIVYYPADLYDVPLHDGSTISIGDFVMAMIVRFDRAKEESPIFDEAEAVDFEAWLATFKGVRITSEDPLIIETYSDAPVYYSTITNTYEDYWYLDAEWNVATWFPTYSDYDTYLPMETGDWTGFWHMITTGWLAEKNSDLAFSESKARAAGVEWMDYTRGASLPILKNWMDWATAENYIPYAPTLGHFISADDAAERWANLQDWYAEKGHFWVGSGPFYLEALDTTEKAIRLKRFEDYPDQANKWLFLLESLA